MTAVKTLILIGIISGHPANALFEGLEDLTSADQSKDFRIDLSSTTYLDGITFDGKGFEDGQELVLQSVQNQPQVNISGNGLCTLMMVDPDAPSKNSPKFRYWLHWLKVNVPCDLGETECGGSGDEGGKGDVIVSFNPSGPPPKTGLHRYIFLLFSQQGQPTGCHHIDPKKVEKLTFRGSFKVGKFAGKWNLKAPIKAAHYKTKNPLQ